MGQTLSEPVVEKVCPVLVANCEQSVSAAEILSIRLTQLLDC